MLNAAKRDKRTMLVVTFLIVLAIFLCNSVPLTGHGPLEAAAGFLRFLIYVFLFTAWGVSLYRRIIQVQVRRYLVAIAVFMVFWLVVRTLKFRVFHAPFENRLCWYFYYIPMLLIPMLALFAAVAMGKPEQYRTPKWMHLLWVPTIALALLVLTNDLHQTVFQFPHLPWTDDAYSYAAGYVPVTAWELGSAVVALGTILHKCRIPHSRKLMWLPLIPFALLLLYIIGYILDWGWMHFVAGDMTVTLCILIAAIFESCIQCGLIQSNTHYNEMFRASTVAAQITDGSYTVLYSAENAVSAETDILKKAEQEPVILNHSIRLSHAAVKNGHVFWQEDISALLSVLDELSGAQEELHSYGSLLEEETKQKEHSKQLEEQKRLYQQVREKTAPSLSRLSALAAQLQTTEDESQAAKVLGKLMVIGAYLKRRSNLICQPVGEQGFSSEEILLCLNESAANLRKCGVTCAAKLRCDGNMDAAAAGVLYDFFEAAVEPALDTLSAMTAFIDGDDSGYSITLFLQCDADMKTVPARFPGASFVLENDAWRGRLSVGKGGAAL